jgi:hypothetical protein
LIKTWEDPIAAIGLKVREDQLLFFIVVRHTPKEIEIVPVLINNTDPVPSLLQHLLPQKKLAAHLVDLYPVRVDNKSF